MYRQAVHELPLGDPSMQWALEFHFTLGVHGWIIYKYCA